MIPYLSKVLYVITGSRKRLIPLVLIFAMTSLLEAAGIWLVGPFINFASDPKSIHDNSLLLSIYKNLGFQNDKQFILAMGISVIVVFLIKSVLYLFCKVYIYKFSFDQKRLLSTRLLNAYLTLPYTFHLKKNTSNIITNISYETHQFSNICLLNLLNIISNFIIVSILLLLLSLTDLLLLVMVLSILIPAFLMSSRMNKKFARWGRMRAEAAAEIIRTINHGLGGLKETRIIGCEKYFENQLDHYANKFSRFATRTEIFLSIPRIGIETILIVFLIGFICISLLFFESKLHELISILSVFAIASIRLLPSTSQLVQGLGKLRTTYHDLDIVYSDLKEIEKEEVVQGHDWPTAISHTDTLRFNDRIDIKKLCYTYPNVDEAAITNLSFSIKKGESIALIGKSGAGKTTLVDLILGFLMPKSGDIEVDGVSVYQNLRAWQNLIGYIPQSIFLIDDTIERNIAFGVPDPLIDTERLQRAIQAAQLEELISTLEQGIKTNIGERGVRLSGGQRQRIGIARALYHERDILVLDEATSALDAETERLVSQAINALSGSTTLIIIAHRFTTIESCDRVYVLERGELIRSGTFGEVVQMAESC